MLASINRVSNIVEDEPDFGFQIDVVRNTEDPGRVFRSFLKLIEFCELTDAALIKFLGVEIQSSLLLEDILQGSIKIWLRNILSLHENISHQNIDLKKVSLYLIKAKKIIIDFINERSTICEQSEITELQNRLKPLVTETEINPLGALPPSNKDLLASIDKFQLASSELQELDQLHYLILKQPSIPINREFGISSEQKENLLTGDTLTSEIEMILKVKKPDYLGESKWQFKHDKKTIDVKIADFEWLSKFKKREVTVGPGDAVQARVEVISKYDFSGEFVSTQYTIQKVIKVIPMPPESQLSLLQDL